MPHSALLLDLDGILRQFDPAFTVAVEQRHGLAPGTLPAAAFDHERLAAVLAFVRQARAAGVPVGLATNASDRLDWPRITGPARPACPTCARRPGWVRPYGVPGLGRLALRWVTAQPAGVHDQ
jgi:hypothetical protein